jgi:hypothetical protein
MADPVLDIPPSDFQHKLATYRASAVARRTKDEDCALEVEDAIEGKAYDCFLDLVNAPATALDQVGEKFEAIMDEFADASDIPTWIVKALLQDFRRAQGRL